jgi:hypothetical protein
MCTHSNKPGLTRTTIHMVIVHENLHTHADGPGLYVSVHSPFSSSRSTMTWIRNDSTWSSHDFFTSDILPGTHSLVDVC